MDILAYIKQCQIRVNNALKLYLPNPKDEAELLHDAMYYAVLNGRKRLRASFIYSLGDNLAADALTLDRVACCNEIIHKARKYINNFEFNSAQLKVLVSFIISRNH
ncbi:geranyltranstransferase [Legionella beliardensis]|uniref:Geranyltranstransferase n=1 Tax=Legionella beliardensis TaxID=91822 RepID=A0A378JSR2_9GAMM|nr:hypothetical protein [Legionella beliardensis]STX55713.1 geranyltranstransferase [Legionella beliardensis]